MRRKICTFLLPLLLTGCSENQQIQNQPKESQIIEINYEYDDVQYLHIKWEEIFNQNLEVYFVYFYSPTCNHCLEIKNWIIEKAIVRNDIYFVKSSQSVVISNNTKNTIGAGFVGDFSILGYPSLAKINNKIVEKNVAGKNQIKNILK